MPWCHVTFWPEHGQHGDWVEKVPQQDESGDGTVVAACSIFPFLFQFSCLCHSLMWQLMFFSSLTSFFFFFQFSGFYANQCHNVMPLSRSIYDAMSGEGTATRWEGQWHCHCCFSISNLSFLFPSDVTRMFFSSLTSFPLLFFNFEVLHPQIPQHMPLSRASTMWCNEGVGTTTRWEGRWRCHCHSSISYPPFFMLPSDAQLTFFSSLTYFFTSFSVFFSRSINHVMWQGEGTARRKNVRWRSSNSFFLHHTANIMSPLLLLLNIGPATGKEGEKGDGVIVMFPFLFSYMFPPFPFFICSATFLMTCHFLEMFSGTMGNED